MPPKTKSSTAPQQYSNFLKQLIEEGSLIDGDARKTIHPHDIPWIDYNLLEKGRKFVKANYATFILSMIISDTVGFVSRQIASTVFKNFYPNNVCGLRFLSSFHTAMTKWLLSDFSGKEFVESIQRVRKLHNIYANPANKPVVPPDGLIFPPEYTKLVQVIQKDLKHVDTSVFPAHLISWKPTKYFTQLDVALVQFGVAPLLLYPERMGLTTTFEEDEGMRGVFHMWAVIGKMIGLEDRFNLALHPDRELYMEIITKIAIPSLKMVDETSIFCMNKMLEGVGNKVMPLMTLKCLLYLSLESVGIQGVELWGSMALYDRVSYFLAKLGLYMIKFDVVRVLLNFTAEGVLKLLTGIYLKN